MLMRLSASKMDSFAHGFLDERHVHAKLGDVNELKHFVADLLVKKQRRKINPVLPKWVANHDHELQ